MKRIFGSFLFVAMVVGIRCAGADAPTITQEPVNQIVTNGGTAQFTVAASGTGPFTYQWQFNGTNLSSVITTVAGNGTSGYSGDGGPATNAEFRNPCGVAFGGGNLYIADFYNSRVRKVDANGIVSTVAGSGIPGYSGDGGPATSANLSAPQAVAVDGTGNLFIASDYCIRKVDLNGIITTVAGNGTCGYSGDGGAATSAQLSVPEGVASDHAGNLYIADYSNNRIRKVDVNGIISTVAGNGTSGYSGDGGPATSAMLNGPWAVAVDQAGNLYIADAYNNCIRKVDVNGGITTVAGNGSAGYSGDGGPATNAKLRSPEGLAVDGAGNLFIAELGNNCIRKVDVNGIITTAAGNGTSGYSGDGGPAPRAQLNYPRSVASSDAGDLFIAEYYNHRIRKMNSLFAATPTLNLNNVLPGNAGDYSMIVSTPNGSATSHVATLSVLMSPTNQTVWVSQTALFSVSVYGAAPLSYLWLRDGTPVTGANASSYSLQNVQASDSGAQFSCVVSNSWGSITSQVATLTVVFPPTFTQQPVAQIVTNGGTARFTVVVSNTGPFTYQWQLNGTNLSPVLMTIAGIGTSGYSGDGGPATGAKLSAPWSVALDGAGNLFIADYGNGRIRKVDAHGIITTVAGNGIIGYSGDGGPATNAALYSPSSVACDVVGNLFIADTVSQRIRKVDTNGIITTVAGNGATGYSGDGGPATDAELYDPECVVVDGAGNLFISDWQNYRVRKVDAHGIITTVAGNGTNGYSGDGALATKAMLGSPEGIALDGAGNLFIADYGNDRIRKVDANGIITTVAGTGVGGYSGDGGLATNACLNSPQCVACDRAGNLLISDGRNDRVRKVDSQGIITTILGGGTGGFSGEVAGTVLDDSGNLFVALYSNNSIGKINDLFATKPTLVLEYAGITNGGNYSVVVSTPYGSVTSHVVTLTVLMPPTNQTVLVGETASFSVSASGTDPLSYLWLRDGAPITGANDSSYSARAVQASDSGAQFSCVVSNGFGSVTSQVATLTVVLPPTFTQQPATKSVTNGNTAVLSVAVSGTGPFTYQWQFNGTNLFPIITTLAGNGTGNFSGDGGPATNAGLSLPKGVAMDSAGNLFIADNNRIRKVDANGIITTVAGKGTNGYSGDGGRATNALLWNPAALTIDDSGNLFISDTANNRIRKVDTNGIITTVAGNGVTGYSGDGGLATNAELWYPQGVALDGAGNLFIADYYNNCIRKVDTNGIIRTVAGAGLLPGEGVSATNALLGSPQGVALDGTGNLFIADTHSCCIRKVDTYGIITTVAGNGTCGYSGDGGLATSAAMQYPECLALDRSGNLFIAELGNRIRKVDTNGVIITVAGNGTNGYSGDGGSATSAMLDHPQGVVLDSAGNLIFADSYNSRIRKVSRLSTLTPALILTNINPDNAGNYSVVVSSPYTTATSEVATLTVLVPVSIASQPTNQTVLGIGTASFSVGASGTGPLSYFWLRNGMPIAGANDSTYSIESVKASDSGAQFSCVVSNACGSITSQVATLTVVFPPTINQQPAATAVLKGNSATFSVAVSGTGPFTYQWQLNGTNVCPIITTVAGGGLSYDGSGVATNIVLSSPAGVAVNGAGNLFIADSSRNRVCRVDSDGYLTTVAGTGTAGYSGDGGQATNASLRYPYGIAFDDAGNLFIVDSGNNRIRKVDTNGVITTVAGDGAFGYFGDGGPATNASLWGPACLTLDGAGDLFIADVYRIREVDTDGIITTVAGNGVSYFSGDGGLATQAALNHPAGVALNRAGNLFIADSKNNRIRKVDANGIITTVAGGGSPQFSREGGAATNAILSNPCGMEFDGLGNLLFADSGNNRVRKVDVNGIITTVAGNGTAGYAGDGGPATSAGLYYPADVALDGSGNLFIADPRNNRVRKVSYLPSANPTLTLQNVGPANIGNYSVIVSSPYGSVTSSVVSLSLTAPLQPQSFAGHVTQATNVALQFKGGTPSYPYVLQSATNLVSPINWQPVVTNSTDGNGVWSFTVTNAAGASRFYRVLGQ